MTYRSSKTDYECTLLNAFFCRGGGTTTKRGETHQLLPKLSDGKDKETCYHTPIFPLKIRYVAMNYLIQFYGNVLYIQFEHSMSPV